MPPLSWIYFCKLKYHKSLNADLVKGVESSIKFFPNLCLEMTSSKDKTRQPHANQKNNLLFVKQGLWSDFYCLI